MNYDAKKSGEDAMIEELGTLRNLYRILFRNETLLNAILIIDGILLVIVVFFYNFTTK